MGLEGKVIEKTPHIGDILSAGKRSIFKLKPLHVYFKYEKRSSLKKFQH